MSRSVAFLLSAALLAVVPVSCADPHEVSVEPTPCLVVAIIGVPTTPIPVGTLDTLTATTLGCSREPTRMAWSVDSAGVLGLQTLSDSAVLIEARKAGFVTLTATSLYDHSTRAHASLLVR